MPVSPGQPSLISDDEGVTLVGSGQDAANLINQKEIHWGQLLEDSLEERLEKAGSLLSDLEKVEGESKEGNLDESKKRAVEGGKQGASLKKLKKDKVVGATGKAVRIETNTVPAAPRVKSELTLPVMPTEVEHSILEDLRNRSENDFATSEHVLGADGGKRSYTLFRGHSGPVYSASFSPFGDFLLSSSSDSTIRLWSTKLNANLVCYKGHNYPVWDVQFSPLGHYFASASHDRTARIWSVDRIQPLRIMAGHLSDVDVTSKRSATPRCVFCMHVWSAVRMSAIPKILFLDCSSSVLFTSGSFEAYVF